MLYTIDIRHGVVAYEWLRTVSGVDSGEGRWSLHSTIRDVSATFEIHDERIGNLLLLKYG